MKLQQPIMKPQDVLLLLKIISDNNPSWNQQPMANAVGLSQSEVSESVGRSQYAGLLDSSGKQVMRNALMEFLQFGIQYVFPQKPGAIVRGVATAHSAVPLANIIVSEQKYVWPSGIGQERGQAIVPLYPSVPVAVQSDEMLYQLLALVDAIRVGRARERGIAIKELKNRILPSDNSLS